MFLWHDCPKKSYIIAASLHLICIYFCRIICSHHILWSKVLNVWIRCIYYLRWCYLDLIILAIIWELQIYRNVTSLGKFFEKWLWKWIPQSALKRHRWTCSYFLNLIRTSHYIILICRKWLACRDISAFCALIDCLAVFCCSRFLFYCPLIIVIACTTRTFMLIQIDDTYRIHKIISTRFIRNCNCYSVLCWAIYTKWGSTCDFL